LFVYVYNKEKISLKIVLLNQDNREHTMCNFNLQNLAIKYEILTFYIIVVLMLQIIA